MLIVRVASSAAEYAAEIMLALSLFRIPFNYIKIVTIAIVMAALSHYFRAVPDLTSFLTITTLLIEIVLLGILFNLPILYSLLIAILGFLAASILEYAVIYFSVELNFAKIEDIEINPLISSVVILTTACIILVFTYFFQTRKIGFMFMPSIFTMKQAVRGYNFGLSAVLIVSIAILQISSTIYIKFSVYGIILGSMALLFLIAIYIAYKHNKKLINEKYERLSKK